MVRVSYTWSILVIFWSLVFMFWPSGDSSADLPSGPEAYQFLHMNDSTGEPIVWSSCPLSWSLDTSDGPSDTEATVVEALEIISEASGLRFERVERNGAISISVVEASAVEGSETRNGKVLGKAGMVVVRDEEGTAIPIYSEVLLVGSALEELPAGFDRYASRGGLVVHEVLHALGMGHVDHSKSIMHPDALEEPFGFSPGDRQALQIIGAACR